MIDVLILGRGFVGKYLEELLHTQDISFRSTTTDGRDGTIKWRLPDHQTHADDGNSFAVLPAADTVLVTFPLQGEAPAMYLIHGYLDYHATTLNTSIKPRWIYLGSTRPFKEIPSTRFTKPNISAGGPRTEAEELIIKTFNGCVLNLAGLWGGERIPEGWSRFYKDKEKLRSRLNDRSLHLIHGADVARSILAVIRKRDLPGGRWLISDKHTYDMLQILIRDPRVRGFLEELIQDDESVRKLLGTDKIDEIKMGESQVTLRIDSSHFWSGFDIEPDYLYAVGEPDPYKGF
ncbi:hypothetical protein GGI15_002128 [Coemansia interrupta]|uniref:Uncharacterized protein n=1 Tax=Coemansia interrupta TaxID=1126814 RepID=A0A9W8HER7_9FUNG|nr:hypothetical protein GGI15_002128 [Coemansia interrupta]